VIYLLDTNACIAVLNDRHAPLTHRLREHRPDEIRLCSIVKAELLYGVHRSTRQAENLAHLVAFFDAFVSLPFDDSCADHYGRIRSALFGVGKPIGANDLLIAAIALRHEAILVTHNVDEFSRVPGLAHEDWMVPPT